MTGFPASPAPGPDPVASETVRYEVADRVATITLNRPERANGFDIEMSAAFADALARADADPDVGAVLLAGAGRRFSAGGDLAAMADAPDRPAFMLELANTAHVAARALAGLGAPVVAAVQGAAAGIGFSFVLGADVVFAGASTKFVTAYTSVGLTPDGGLSWLLPRAVGQRRASELLLRSAPLDAAAAEALGIVSEVVPDGEELARAQAIAAELAARPAHALARTRRLIREGWDRPLEAHLDAEAMSIADASTHPETTRRIDGFLGRGG